MAELDPHTATFSASEPLEATPLRLFSPGTRLANRYEIRRVIDWGGFAVVYVAYDRELRREIALKVLRPDRMSDAALTRFRREVAVARDASSPRLVRVFDIETSDGAIYLTMELVEGGSLRKRMWSELQPAGGLKPAPCRMPIEEVIRISAGIVEGLQALHALGIVHRDVKPGNVLLDSAGEVKLADFGLARHLESDSAQATTTGAIVGTLAYLSPEQALGHAVDHRADLYALGVVMFEMLTGTVPFEGESPLGTLLARMKASPHDVRRLRRDCPRWLAAVVARLLERKPEDRYASAAGVLEDLRRRRSALAPRRVVRAAAAGAALLILLAVAFFAWRTWQHRNAFSHLVASGEGVISAVSRSGKTLWLLPGYDEETALKYALLERGHGGRPEIVAVLRSPEDLRIPTVHTLSFLDPQTGRVTRRARVPDSAEQFADLPARYTVGSIVAHDLDGDGGEEVMTTFTQVPEWPSYTTVYEPRIGRARLALVATGHHHVAGAEDVDSDGRKELLFQGIHNGWGWSNAAAAVRLQPAVNRFDAPEEAATTPDLEGSPAMLAWYTYLPRGRQPGGIRAVADENMIRIDYPDGRTVPLTLHGVDPRLTSPAARAAARERAFTAMRDADRLSGAGSADAALAANDTAVRQAEIAGMPLLVEAAQIRRGRILITAGRIDEAEAHYERISAAGSAVALEAAERFHLHGDLERAMRWYRRALRLAQPSGIGRSPHEVIKGFTLAAAEAKRFEEGLTEVSRFFAAYGVRPNDVNVYYREFLRWRAGETPELTAHPNWFSIDLAHYWALEFAWARGAAPESLLPRFPAHLEERSPTRGALLSLRAELLDRLGRRDEARRLIATALQRSEIDSTRQTIARGHRDLVRERHARIVGR